MSTWGLYNKYDPLADVDVNNGNLWHKANAFDKQNAEQKSKIMEFISSNINRHYHIAFGLLDKANITEDLKLEWFKKLCIDKSYGTGELFKKLNDESKLKARDIINNSEEVKDTSILFLLLNFPDYSIQEEIKVLRSMAKTSVPHFVLDLKYKPRFEALSVLPTVMRLEAIEALLEDNKIGYNVFEYISNEDEFNGLLFSAITRHPSRVESAVSRYRELKLLGTEGQVQMHFNCSNCGEFSIILKNKVVKTKARFEKTDIGRVLLAYRCSICGEGNVKNNGIVGDLK